METLPIELITEILFRLDPPSLYQASSVCSLWRVIALSQTVKINLRERLIDRCRKGDRLSVIKSRFRVEWTLSALRGASAGRHHELAEIIMKKAMEYPYYLYCYSDKDRQRHRKLRRLLEVRS